MNSQLRPTCIRNWLRNGFSVHDVTQRTRQHESTVKHYDPEATLSKRLEMSGTLFGKPMAPPKATVTSLPSTSAAIRSLPTNPEASFKCYYCSDVKTSLEELELHETSVHGVVRVPQDEPENQLLDLDQADQRSLPRTSAAIPSLPSTSAPVRSMPSNSKSVYSTLETQIVQFKTFNCQFCPEKKKSMEELQKHELDNHGEYRLQYGKKTANFAAVKSLGARARANQGQVVEMEVYKCRHCSEVKTSMVEMEMHELHNHGRDGVEKEEPKRKILNLDPFDDDAIDFGAIEKQAEQMTVAENQVEYEILLQPVDTIAEKRQMIHFEGQNDGVKRKLVSEDSQILKKRKPLAEINENQMDLFKNPIAAADFFTEWKGEVKEDKQNHQKTIDQVHTLLSRDQFLRAKDQQIREKAQDAQIKTTNYLMAML